MHQPKNQISEPILAFLKTAGIEAPTQEEIEERGGAEHLERVLLNAINRKFSTPESQYYAAYRAMINVYTKAFRERNKRAIK